LAKALKAKTPATAVTEVFNPGIGRFVFSVKNLTPQPI
jgi:hypothetical protein